jgi:hypothetical protein
MSLSIDEQKAKIWNVWAYYSRSEDGCIIHAQEEGSATAQKGRAICGTKVSDGGGLNLKEDPWEPSCIRCRKILIKRGLLDPDEYFDTPTPPTKAHDNEP